jgi:DNA-binding NarL/FixJ family response regulator
VTSVLVADDQELVRTGLCTILERSGLEVLGEAADGRAAVREARRLRPDVVLMDIRMPVLDGIAATRELLAGRQDGRPRVLVLTTFDLDEYVFEALRAGASGFLLKDAPPARLVAAVHAVSDGEALLAPQITRRLVARGLSNAEIAEALVLTLPTVKTHVSRVLLKLGLRDRVQAVVLAYEAGLMPPR